MAKQRVEVLQEIMKTVEGVAPRGPPTTVLLLLASTPDHAGAQQLQLHGRHPERYRCGSEGNELVGIMVMG